MSSDKAVFKPGEVCLHLCEIAAKLESECYTNVPPVNIKEFGALSKRQIRAIVALDHLGTATQEQITLKKLAERLNLTLPATSILVDSMVKAGLFKRAHSKTDRRAVNIELTGKGEKYANKIKDAMMLVSEGFEEKMTKNEKEVFVNVLEIIYTHLFL